MGITLGTNIPSYTARTNLNFTTDKLTKTMERLSTGLKINRAGDDAAGLVISQNMDALVRGSKQAQTNIQTAKSLLTVAEDGMVTIGDHLQRMNDLLVNMANDTNDIDSRTAAVREIIERIEEINRLADSTNFNGKTMLDGTAATESIIVQMGPDESELSILDISPAMTDCRTASLGVDLPKELNPDRRQALDTDGKTPTGDIYVKTELADDDGNMKTVYVPEGSTDITADIGAAAFNALGHSLFNPTNEDCRNYMAKVQGAIATLSTNRGLLGAYENRMDSSYDQLAIRIETLQQAKSIYTDTDVAEESTNLTTQQILQQYNVALLANANTIPQLALSLIGG